MEGKAQPMFLSCTSRRIDPGSQSVVKVRSENVLDWMVLSRWYNEGRILVDLD